MRSPVLFFSYRKMNANLVRSLANWARASGVAVWFDEDTVPLRSPDGADIEGEEWRQHVADGIRDSEYVLLFTNAQWVLSDACCWEFEVALEAHLPSTRRILQICIPDDRTRFNRHQELTEWVPTLVWSSCEAFAGFLRQQCGIVLDPRYSPEPLGRAAYEWATQKNALASLRLPPCRQITRGCWSSSAWPHRVMEAASAEVPWLGGDLDAKLSENPFLTLLAGRVPNLESFGTQQPRDELIQRAYREIARSFFDTHEGFVWLGTHQFWLNERCHFALTYRIPAGHRLGDPSHDVTERLYSIQWLDPSGRICGEMLVTFRAVPGSQADEGFCARFAQLADTVTATLEAPQPVSPRFLDRRILSVQGIMVAFVVLLGGLLVSHDPRWLVFLSPLGGWLVGQLLAFASPSMAAYRTAIRKRVFIWGCWPLVGSVLWSVPIFACAIGGWHSLLQYPWWCGLGGMAFGYAYCNLVAAREG